MSTSRGQEAKKKKKKKELWLQTLVRWEETSKRPWKEVASKITDETVDTLGAKVKKVF